MPLKTHGQNRQKIPRCQIKSCLLHLTPPGNNQTTLDCVSLDALGNVEYSPHCLYGVNPFYCSYGEADDPSVPPGYCCAAGTRAVQHPLTGEWECRVPTQCGVGIGRDCGFDFRFDRPSWIDSLFLGDTNNWCHSALPLLTEEHSSSLRSEACCPIFSYGTLGFYIIDSNVKIFGSD